MQNKTVLITGASRGIGRALALTFARAGCRLVLTCRSRSDLLEQVRRDTEAAGARCMTFAGDISQYDVCQDLFNRINDQFGAVDILINNAGISHIGLFQDMTRQQWNQVISTNLDSVFNCCHLAVPAMIRKHHGKIINISSVWGISGASCEVAYSASKGGVNAFTRALAKELAPSGIQVNAIACGAIDTEMNQFLSAEERSLLEEEIPSGRMGRPDEVAHLALSICCGSDYLTGQIITLDGGWI